ncbi:DUF7351 domain-containing protein [Haladaptatus caseinilyticus]|uniref:DUF7351 domain-containing protein n=1 Tax=Haladaptatus caseinilyticus TaxID=2993314 RepID=UPI00224AA59E|nr:hypothetical protein [Haladaptatus caseinilyticus]
MTADDLAAPRAAFSVLSHEVRLDILLSLFEKWEGEWTEPRGYAELMQTVGIEDSGQFNYHLNELRGSYIRRVDDGYVPTAAATALYRAVLANRPMEDADRTLHVDFSCPTCDGKLIVEYRRGFLSVQCSSCESPASRYTYPFPANGLTDRSDTDVLLTFHRRLRSHLALARDGQCPFCTARTTRDLVTGTPSILSQSDSQTDVFAKIECLKCTFQVAIDPLVAIRDDVRIVCALRTLEIATVDTFDWELPTPDYTVHECPFQIELVVESDEGTLLATVDDSLSVLSIQSEADCSM